MQLLAELKTLRTMDERHTGSSGSAAASSAAPAAAASDADWSRFIPAEAAEMLKRQPAHSFCSRFQMAAANALAERAQLAPDSEWECLYNARWAACSAMAERGEFEEQLTI